MTDRGSHSDSADKRKQELEAISIVQRGNLKVLERTLRKQWRLGQNIVLCWSSDERGLLVLMVPHYFLGNYCALETAGTEEGRDNEAFVRGLISGRRRKARDELFKIAERLEVSPTFIKLDTALAEDKNVLHEVEEIIKRYGLSYVDSRAVLLFDIANFSLYTPFEQASQLNSLSYSLNSAYNKLQAQGIEINFARTTTGDGYYVWNRDLRPYSNQDLFFFMMLVVADNAVARAASRGNTVPVIRTAYHIGSHYELYQAEGVNPTVFSYIVGDVTIELARMVDLAQPHQILVGDFDWERDGSTTSTDKFSGLRSAPTFVRHCNRELSAVQGLQFSRKAVRSMECTLTEGLDEQGRAVPRRFRIVDKHGLSRFAYNLQLQLDLEGEVLYLGLDQRNLPGRHSASQEVHDEPASGEAQEDAIPYEPTQADARTADEMFDDLASMLRKRAAKKIVED